MGFFWALKLDIKNQIDDQFLYTYLWTKEKTKIFGHKHKIKAIISDKYGNTDSEEITVWKFL